MTDFDVGFDAVVEQKTSLSQHIGARFHPRQGFDAQFHIAFGENPLNGAPTMKSPKQRRQEIKARRLQRAERQACRANARPVDRPVGTMAVTPALLRPTTSYGIPDFVQRGYYQDRPFRCKDCGVDEVWTAAQQRWWYEVAQGEVWTTAVRCRACRQRERTRKTEARRVHLAGLAAKSASTGSEP